MEFILFVYKINTDRAANNNAYKRPYFGDRCLDHIVVFEPFKDKINSSQRGVNLFGKDYDELLQDSFDSFDSFEETRCAAVVNMKCGNC